MINRIEHCHNHNRFIAIDSEELTGLELIHKNLDKTNEVVDGLNQANINIADRVTKRELKEVRKLDEKGDFKGSWFGVKAPVYSEPGIQGQVLKNIEDIERLSKNVLDIENENFENYLNYQEPWKYTSTLINGQSDFPQGFAVNDEANEIYISRQINGGSVVKISKYRLDSMQLLATKEYTKSGGAYQEGLPFYYNSLGELCFLVRTTYDKNIAIFNFDTGVLSQNINVLGGSKVGFDRDRKYFITGFGSADRLEGIYVYDFKSITETNPILLSEIMIDPSITNGEKTQGIGIVNGKIVLGRGSTNPVVSVIDMQGNLLGTSEVDKKELALSCTNFSGSQIEINSFRYENEGVSFVNHKGYEIPVLLHIIDDKLYLTKIGFTEFNKLTEKRNASIKDGNGVKWTDITSFETGVTSYGEDVSPQFCKDKNGFVYLRGVVTHANNGQAPNMKLFTLPFPYFPNRNHFFTTVASGGANRHNRIEVRKNGDVYLVATTSESDKPFTCLDGIIFSTL